MYCHLFPEKPPISEKAAFNAPFENFLSKTVEKKNATQTQQHYPRTSRRADPNQLVWPCWSGCLGATVAGPVQVPLAQVWLWFLRSRVRLPLDQCNWIEASTWTNATGCPQMDLCNQTMSVSCNMNEIPTLNCWEARKATKLQGCMGCSLGSRKSVDRIRT